MERPVDSASLLEHLWSEIDHEELRNWVWELSRWGHRLPVVVAYTAGEWALDTWCRGLPTDSLWPAGLAASSVPRRALDAIRGWLSGGISVDAALEEEVRSLIRIAEVWLDETATEENSLAGREQFVAAGHVVLCAVEAATWSEAGATQGIPDEAERAAQAAAGPSREAWNAVRYLLAARPEISAVQVRDRIRLALLADRGLSAVRRD